MKLPVVLAVLIGTLALACSTAAPAPAEPTPNIDATVEAKLAQERAVDATVEARAKELVAEQPTATPYPTYTPIPTATLPPKPTNTPAPQRINTPKPTPTNTPTLVPNATSVPTPTPRPIPTGPEEGRLTPDGKLIYRNGIWQLLVPLTPTPPSKFEGGFVMLMSTGFNISGDIQFKIGDHIANQTMSYSSSSEMILLDLYADSSQSKVNINSYPISRINPAPMMQTGPPPVIAGRAYSGGGILAAPMMQTGPPTVIAGRAYINGQYAPDGTVVSAWTNGEEILEARTTVVNNPTPLAEPKFLSILQTEIPPPFPLPTPCPTYKNNCDVSYYSGRLADDIKAMWQTTGDGRKWWFYSPDPAWELAHNLPPDMCNYWGFTDTCWFGVWYRMTNDVHLDADTAGTIGLVNQPYEWSAGWNLGVSLEWPVPLKWPVSRTPVPTPTPDSYTYLDAQILDADLVLTVDKSPYFVRGTIQVPAGINVVVKPGVTIDKDDRKKGGFYLDAEATFSALGTSDQPITLSSINIDPGLGSPSGVVSKIRISNAVVTAGFYCYLGCKLDIEIVDSHIDFSGISNHFGIVVLRRNVIGGPRWGYDCCPIFLADKLEMVNNCFLNAPPRMTLGGIDSTVKHNTFHSSNSISGRISLEGSDDFSIANNYWHQIGDKAINSFLSDSTSDIRLSAQFITTPTLSQPHADTPSC